MDTLVASVKFVLGEGREWFVRTWRLIRHPTQALGLSIEQAWLYVALTSIVCVVLDFLEAASTPALLRTGSQWLVALETEVDRRLIQFPDALRASAFVFGFYYFTAVILSVVGTGFLWAYIRRRRIPLRQLFLALAPALSVSRAMMGLGGVVAAAIGRSEIVSNWMFVVLSLPVCAFYLYGAFGVSILAVRTTLKSNFVGSLILVFIAEIFAGGIVAITDIETRYRGITNLEPGRERSTVLIEEANSSLQQEQYEESIAAARDALVLTPRNLMAELTITYARKLQVWTAIRDAELSNQKQDIDLARAAARTIVDHLEHLARTYSDLPSVQLFVASEYESLHRCQRANVGYSTVARMAAALPGEVAFALLRQGCVLAKTQDKAASVFLPESTTQELLTVLRMLTVAPREQRLILFISRWTDGVRLEGHPFAPSDVIRSYDRPDRGEGDCDCQEDLFDAYFRK